jgi:tetratricopeptide (TPR) repeat protein
LLANSTDDNREERAAQIVSALEFELGAPSDANHAMATELVAETLMHVVEMVDPAVAATIASHRSVKNDLKALLDGQATIYDEILDLPSKLAAANSVSAMDTVGLPPTVLPWLERASINGQQYRTFLAWMEPAEAASQRIVKLSGDPPEWLSSSGELLIALGCVAEARRIDAATITAFSMAADLLPAEAASVLARAAFAAARMGDRSSIDGLTAKARILATGLDALLLDCVEVALGESVEWDELVAACERALSEGAPEPQLLQALHGQALAARGNLDQAVAALASYVEQSPDHTGLRSTLVLALMARAEVDDSTSRADDAHSALGHALKIRDSRRSWGGDSGEAVELACQAALLLGDIDLALDLASEIEGEATPDEAARPSLRQLVALFRSERGQTMPDAGSEFELALFGGLQAAQASSSMDVAAEKFTAAVELAANEAELDRAQRALASLGVLDIPRIAEVRERDAVHAEVLLGIAEMSGGDLSAARARLRPLSGSVPMAALLLGDIEAEAGNLQSAGDILATAANRFNDPRLYHAAARRYLKAGLPQDAMRAAAAGRTLLPAGAGAIRKLREVEIEAAAALDDVTAVEQMARMAWNDGDHREQIRWLRVQALIRMHRVKDAWAEVTKVPALVPDNDVHASLFLGLLMRRDPQRLDLLIETLERFPDSHDVHAKGLSLFLAFDRDFEVDPSQVRKLQLFLTQYVERYPDSPVIRAQTVSHDSTEELVEQMRQMMAPDKERDDQLHDLAVKAQQGQMPIGLVASIVGRSLIEVILTGSAIGFVSIPGEQRLLDEEIEIARRHLDGDVVIDETSVVVASFLKDRWTTVLAAFRSVSIADAAFAEIDDAVFRKLPAGTLRWNHETDQPELVDISEDELAAMRERRQVIRDWVNELEVIDGRPMGDLARISELDPDHAWLAGLGAAQRRQTALLCDDPALAALARSAGIDAFGLCALMVALIQEGRIEPSELSQMLGELFDAQAMDLPLSPTQICGIAQQRGWPLRPSLRPFSRSAFWRDVEEAVDAFEMLLSSLPEGESAAEALYSAIIGLSRAVVAGSPARAIATLFVMTVVSTAADPPAVATLISATRQAAEIEGLPDPFDECVLRLIQTFSNFSGPALVAQSVTTLIADLDKEDRERAVEILLSHS